MDKTLRITMLFSAAVCLAGCMEEISRKETWGAGTNDFRSHYRGGNPLGASGDVQFERQAPAGTTQEEKGWFDDWFK